MIRNRIQKFWGILILGIVFPGASLSQITFERTYGGVGHDFGTSVQQTSDGGYIIGSTTNSFSGGFKSQDIYLIKTDSLGDTLWTRTYGGTYSDYCFSVQQTQDGGYVLTGWINSYDTGGGDVFLLKTDSLGNTHWLRSFGGALEDVGYSVDQTSDGGFIIAGWTFSFGAGGSDVYLIKTDSLGNTLWTKIFGGILSDAGRSVQETSDGGFIIGGQTRSFGVGGDVYLIKTDSSGDTLWTRTYGGIYYDVGYSVQETSDGGYIITGYTNSFNPGSWDVYLIKTDPFGNKLWDRNYGGNPPDFGTSVQQTSDGEYIVVGSTSSFGSWPNDVWLIKTDSLGDTVLTRTYGGTSPDAANSVNQTSDGGFIIAGWTTSFGAGGGDVYLIKTGPFGIHCTTFDGLDQTIVEAKIDNEGVRISLQAKANNTKRQFDRGNLRASGNILCALLNEVNAQDGKHIEPNSAQEIRDCVLSLSDVLGIPLPCNMRDKKGSSGKRTTILWNSPNPFTSKTNIYYQVLDKESSFPKIVSKNPRNIELKIYDITGKVVRTLVERDQDPGFNIIDWDGTDGQGDKLSSGIYFYRLQDGDFTDTKKLILLR
jgi:hypothetical protein